MIVFNIMLFFNYFCFMVVIIIILLLPFIGWYLFTGIFDMLTSNKYKPTKDTYITHIHNDNRQVHLHNSNLPEEDHHLN